MLLAAAMWLALTGSCVGQLLQRQNIHTSKHKYNRTTLSFHICNVIVIVVVFVESVVV